MNVTPANEKDTGFMNDQIAAGADLVSDVAESVKGAAESLDQNAPQIAGLMREVAERSLRENQVS
jgi:hypothetical protein